MLSNEQLRQFSWTDQGNAKALKGIYGAQLRYCVEQDAWYRWNGLIWLQVPEGEIRQLAIVTATRQKEAWMEPQLDQELAAKARKYYQSCENRQRFVATAATAAELPELRISVQQFNANKWILGLENGQIDLVTGSFTPPTPSTYLTMKANVQYDPEATCPKWIKFLDQVFMGNVELIDFMQRAAGYSLTGSVEEQLMFICIGEGANGKSTYLNVLRDMLGDYSKAAPFSTFSAKNRSEMTNDLARLMGSRYVTIIESDEDAFLAEAKIKQATGGDPIPCRFLRREFFEYIPQFKIWMAANRLPQVRGADHGNMRRPVIVPFGRQFKEAERISGLQDQLYEERAGILNWMLEGLAMWHERKLVTHMPDCLKESKMEYQSDMDITAKWMDACVELDKTAAPVKAEVLYSNYRHYIESIGHKPKSITLWGIEMKQKLEHKRTKKGIVYLGAVVAQPEEWPQEVEV